MPNVLKFMVLFLPSQKPEFMSTKGKNKKRSDISKEAITEQIQSILTGSPQQTFNYKQIAKKLNINDSSEKKMISEVLMELTGKGIDT